jgi:hypothetical protein
MYTFIIQDTQGNFYVSKESYKTKEQAEEMGFLLAEYDFTAFVEVIKCEDVVCFNFNPILN